MDPTAPAVVEVVAPGARRGFPPRLAGGVSQPPWSARAAVIVMAITIVTFFGVPELLHAICGIRGRDVLFPVLVTAFPTLCCLLYLARQAGTTVEQAFGLRGARLGAVLLSTVVLFLLEILVLIAADVLFRHLGFKPSAHDDERARAIASSPLIVIDATVWAPICEELMFRGFLYTSLRKRFGVKLSVVVTAAAFGLIHTPGSINKVGVLFCDALLSSFWYERTRSLWPNIIAHALNNILITVLWLTG